MINEQKKVLMYFGGAVVFTVLVWFVFDDLLAVLCGAVIGFGGAIFLARKLNSQTEIVPDQPTESTESVEAQVSKPAYKTQEQLEEDLISFNTELRVQSGLEEGLIVQVESVVDLLVEVLPNMNQNYPSSKVTALLNRMFETDISEQVVKIAQLSKEKQEEGREIFEEMFQELLEKVREAKSLLEEDKSEEAEAMALYLSRKLNKV